MNDDSKKAEKLKEAMDFFDKTHITTDDAVKFFKFLMERVKDIKDTNRKEWKLIHEAMQKIPDKMMREMYAEMSKTEKKMVEDCTEKCDKMCSEMEEKHEKEMAKMELEMRLLKSDREAIIEDALAKVPEQILETPESVREKLESIQEEEEKLSISSIAHLEKKLKDLEKRTTQTKPLGGFNYNSMNFHIVDDETPTGTVNGVNTDFVLGSSPNPASSLKVYRGGARQRITEDYTLSGSTISFTVAPAAGEIILCDYRT